ncbi:MAG: FHA domain-containing protein [bacterium]
MERLILEIPSRSLAHYYRLDNFPVTIGRAYDNDIILSHRSVSAHHLAIDQADNGDLLIENLSRENGTQVNKITLNNQPARAKTHVDNFSLDVQLGQLKTRIISESTRIEDTYSKHCKGWFCALLQPFWSISLLILAFMTVVLGIYLDTQTEQNLYYYLQGSLTVLLGLFAVTLLMTGITKLVTHCWQFFPILSISALLVLVPELLQHLGHFLNYWFTHDTPLSILGFLSNFLLLPLLLFLFINRLNRYPSLPSIGFAILASSPFIIYQAYDVIDTGSLGHEFSDEPSYNQTLSHLDLRNKQTIDINQFIANSRSKLDSEMNESLSNYRQEKNTLE